MEPQFVLLLLSLPLAAALPLQALQALQALHTQPEELVLPMQPHQWQPAATTPAYSLSYLLH